jgi:hypothetical protein
MILKNKLINRLKKLEYRETCIKLLILGLMMPQKIFLIIWEIKEQKIQFKIYNKTLILGLMILLKTFLIIWEIIEQKIQFKIHNQLQNNKFFNKIIFYLKSQFNNLHLSRTIRKIKT